MTFLAANCMYFLIGAIVLGFLTMVNQLIRMKSMMSSMKSMDAESGFNNFFRGIGLFVVTSFGTTVCAVLFVVGLVIRLMA